MKFINYLGLVVVLSVLGILYSRYERKFQPEVKGDDLVKKYLLNENIVYNKPNLWIHVKNEINARDWINFGSRNSDDVNKPYIRVCIESIIKYNQDDFNIFIINDESFNKLLDDWNIVIDNVPNPLKENVRKVGIGMILYNHGGINLPRSFLCMKKLKLLYKEGVNNNKMFCVENINRSVDQYKEEYLPDLKILGCPKYNDEMKNYYTYMNESIGLDNTDEINIMGKFNNWLKREVEKYNINVLDGRLIGVKDKYNKYVCLEDLMGESLIGFDKFYSGILVDEDELEKRTKYKWFNRLSKKQLFESNTILGEQMLISHGETI